MVDQTSRAESLLKPIRQRILTLCRQPNSATAVASALGIPRQRVGYHVRALEREGLLRHVGDQRKGNCVERLLQTSAQRYMISPATLGALAAEPGAIRDRFSSDYLLAVAGRTLSEVGRLQTHAQNAGKQLPTFTLETVVRFASPQDQNAFAEDLANATADLVKKYHREDGDGRSFQFVMHGYPGTSRVRDAVSGTHDMHRKETDT